MEFAKVDFTVKVYEFIPRAKRNKLVRNTDR